MSIIGDQIQAYLEPLAQEGKFCGALLASNRQTILYSQGFGKANVELDVNNTSSTKFRIGSITKTFTSAAILQLVQKGLLDLDEPISKYITAQKHGDRITIHHLLTHTSGISNYTDDPHKLEWSIQPSSPAQLIGRFSLKDLESSPGETYKYSNSGYILLGMILEQVSGLPYDVYLDENIFGPLGMANSGVDHPTRIINRRAAGYQLNEEGTLMNAPYFDPSNAYSAGALYSTVEDLHIWDQALYTEKLLENRLIAQMYTPFRGAEGFGYGYGWFIQDTPFGTLATHSGGIPGFCSVLLRFLDHGVSVVVLSNVYRDVSDIGKKVSELVLDSQPI